MGIQKSAWTISISLLGLLVMVGGCKIDSADSAIRSVDVNIAGVYRNNGARIISQHTGASITSLNVIQDGDHLQGIDNNGLIFRGRVGAVTTAEDGSRTATFTMEGQTTAGAEGVMTGTFKVQGTSSSMTGTWAEPTTFGNIRASAAVAPPPDPGPGPQPTNGTSTNANSGGGASQQPPTIDINRPDPPPIPG